jgi:hypothetical protein
MMGDNANIYRLVNPAGAVLLTFNTTTTGQYR